KSFPQDTFPKLILTAEFPLASPLWWPCRHSARAWSALSAVLSVRMLGRIGMSVRPLVYLGHAADFHLVSKIVTTIETKPITAPAIPDQPAIFAHRSVVV